MKNPLTPAGIKPATYRFVAQHLNHCATVVPPHNDYPDCNFSWFYSVPKGKYRVTTQNYHTTTYFWVLSNLLITTIPLLNAVHAVIMALSLKMWCKYINKIVSASHESTQSNPSQTSLLKEYSTFHCRRTRILSET